MTSEERLKNTNLDSIDYQLVRGLSRIKSKILQRGDTTSYNKLTELLGIYAKGGDFTEDEREVARQLIDKINEKERR